VKKLVILLIIILSFNFVNAQNFTDTIKWQNPVRVENAEKSFSHLFFDGATFNKTADVVPVYHKIISIPLNNDVSEIYFEGTKTINVNQDESKLLQGIFIEKNIKINYYTTNSGNKNYLIVEFVPIKRVSTDNYEKITSFTINYKLKAKEKSVNSNSYASHSVLKDGKWLKVAVNTDGLYKITFDELNEYGVTSSDGVKVYGGYHAVLPEIFTEVVTDDLQELAIYIEKGSDGVFNSGDYIIFFGQGPNVWNFDGVSSFRHLLNNYSSYNYYFITTGSPKLIQTVNSLPESSANQTANNFIDFKFHELETENLIHSGKLFVGEKFIPTFNNYSFNFNFPNIDTDEDVNVYGSFVAKSTMQSTFSLSVGSNSQSVYLNPTASSSYTYAAKNTLDWVFKPSSNSVNLSITYNNDASAPESMAWLDYIGVVAKRKLSFYDNSMIFRNYDVIGIGNITKFNLTNCNSGLALWDITNPYEINNINYNISGSELDFVAETDTLKTYVIFNGSSYISPVSVQTIDNQDLHGIENHDYIILSHPDFTSYANQLADIHRTHDGMSVKVIDPAIIYNEFSSGKPDIAAIRNFLKMIHDRTADEYPKYLLLFGDGSFDNRTPIINGNSNFILTYESEQSLSSTSSYVSDDYYGMLEDGANMITGILNVGVGRFTVQTTAESDQMLNKIRNYISSNAYGNWRNMLTFIGDDGDGNLHTNQSDELATGVYSSFPVYNIEKIYFDAYPQVSTPSGERYPDVNSAFKERMERGALILNYTGHGNELGLAHERILAINDVLAWKNFNTLPLFFTATCEFSRWDDKTRTTAGEYVFLNPSGGGIGLLTTTRLVYATQNFVLSKAFYENTFGLTDFRLGDMARITKNLSGSSVNKRNFSLIGDPALKLAYPEYNIVATSVNSSNFPTIDTLKAMQKVTITGEIHDDSDNLLDFDGIVYPIVYDKFKTITTLGNGDNTSIDFQDQSSVLFKGKASVKDGKFSFTFIVPKDIAYNYGYGKLSFYANNSSNDARGYNAEIIIGGSSDSINADNKGPEIELYLNNEQFVSGGLTDEEPILLSNLFDESGINTVGNGIGHDLTAVLDENTSETIILNDFYESKTDDFQKGALNYQLSKLANGSHTLKLKAWDVFNNSSEAYIDFVVSESANLALDHIFNYPNPFTTNTDFYFDHNMPNSHLDVMINIFTVSGKSVKTLEADMNPTGYRSDPINWNGLDDYGDKIGKGVYIYKLTVRTDTGEEVTEYEKLVLLR
jgi:hypothetical protein